MSAAPESFQSREDLVRASHAVNLCLMFGRMLFSFGATAERIKDSTAYLARYLGYQVDVLVSYDALIITVSDGATFRTRIDSSRRLAGLNLFGLVRASHWLSNLPRPQATLAELEQALNAINDAPPKNGPVLQTFAAGCAGAAFCIVNNGDPVSWICCFLIAAFIFTLRRPMTTRDVNVHVAIFSVTLAGGFLTAALEQVLRTSTPAIALVAPVLFLVPGVPLINGGMDIVRNHVTIGMSRVGFTLAVLGDLCLGLGFALSRLPERIDPPFSLSGAQEILLLSLAGALGSAALACIFNGSIPIMALCALGGFTGRLVRALCGLGGLDLMTSSLIAVLCSTLAVTIISERLRWPAAFVSVMAALPMIPGYFAIAGLHSLLTFAAGANADPAQLATGLQALLRALFISVALIVGIIGPVIVLQRGKERI